MPELGQRIPDEEQLQQRRRRAEQPRVEEDEPAYRAARACAPERQEEADDDRDREGDERDLDGEKRSPPERMGGERFPEEMAGEREEQGYFTSPVGMLYFFASLTSVPFAFSALIALAIFAPIASPLR
jgi:hypothetical protein